MSIQLITAVFADPYFTGDRKAEMLVALAIADFARKGDGKAWPGIERLAQKARTSLRGVQDACRSMEKAGKLRVEIGCGEHGTNAYYLLCAPAAVATPAPAAVAAPAPPLAAAAPRSDCGGCNGAPEEAPEEAAAGCTQTVSNHQEPPISVIGSLTVTVPMKSRLPARGRASPAPTLEEAEDYAFVRGIPEKAVAAWWNEHDALRRGDRDPFTDRHGRPLHRWESSLDAYGSKWKENERRWPPRSSARSSPSRAAPPVHGLVIDNKL